MDIKGIEQLKKHEGFRGYPYKCSEGKTTIGYGRNLDSNPLTKNEAENLLFTDIEKYISQVEKNIPIVKELNEARKWVLYNMCYNMGIKNLLKFKKFINAINENDFKSASMEMLDSKWAVQVGSRSKELAKQMREGVFYE